jgi:hypothetical protein
MLEAQKIGARAICVTSETAPSWMICVLRNSGGETFDGRHQRARNQAVTRNNSVSGFALLSIRENGDHHARQTKHGYSVCAVTISSRRARTMSCMVYSTAAEVGTVPYRTPMTRYRPGRARMAVSAEDSSVEPATRMAVPVWKLPQRSRRVEGRLWVDLGRPSCSHCVSVPLCAGPLSLSSRL